MKKFTSVVVLSLATTLFAFSQYGCASPQPTTSTNVNMATPAPTPDKGAIEAEILKLENDWPRIIKDHDVATVKKIEADDAVFIYPDGSIGDKATDVKDMEAGALTADSWELSEIKVIVLDANTAVAMGRNIVKNGKYKGQPMPYADFRFIDTFARRNGQWQVVAGAAIPLIKSTASPTPKASPSPSASPALNASPAVKASPTTKPTPASPAMKAAPNIKTAPASAPTRTKTP
jgi:ketosteroid isomerase-like protein